MKSIIEQCQKLHLREADQDPRKGKRAWSGMVKALERSFQKNGFDAFLMTAYQIEAGSGPFKDVPFDHASKYLYDVLGDALRKDTIGVTPMEMTGEQRARLSMYRSKLNT